jgi:cytochrome c peroxidase
MTCACKWLDTMVLCAAVAVAGAAGCADKKQPVIEAEADSTNAVANNAVADGQSSASTPQDAQASDSARQGKLDEAASESLLINEPTTIAKSPERSGKVKLGSAELTAGIPGEGPLKDDEIQKWLDNPANHEVLDIELPFGLAAGAAQIQGVEKNPLTRAKIELGRQLYFDPRLSADLKISCASCHNPDEGFARHSQVGIGIRDQAGGRNSPVSYNRILSGPQFWDGRAGSLEDQAVGPIANAIEMGNTHEACVECLKAVPGYKLQFEKVFGRLDIDAVGQALASFERAIVTEPTPYDYYERLQAFEKYDPEDIKEDAEVAARYEVASSEAKTHPLSESAKRGRAIYFSDKGGCSACHVGANLTDEKYHNIGIGMDKGKVDIGREEVTKDAKDHGAFKTPTIRNVALSAPYMHDGSLNTLEEVVEWYAKGGHPNPSLSEKIKKLNLTDQDKKDLVEFMKQGCSSDFPKIARNRLPE